MTLCRPASSRRRVSRRSSPAVMPPSAACWRSRHRPIQHARLCRPLRAHLRRGRAAGLCGRRYRLWRRQQCAADGARLRGGRVAGFFISTRPFPTVAATCPASRWCGWKRLLAKIKAMLDARRDGDLLICARTDVVAIEGLGCRHPSACQLFMEAGADMAKPMGRHHR